MRIDKLSCSHHRTILSRRCWSFVRSVGWSVVRLRYCNVDALNIVLLAGNDCITMNNGTWDFSGRALWQSGCCITVSQRRGTRREQQTVNATNVQPLSLFLSVGPSFFLCLSFFLPLPLSRSRSCSRSRATILLEIISNLWKERAAFRTCQMRAWRHKIKRHSYFVFLSRVKQDIYSSWWNNCRNIL